MCCLKKKLILDPDDYQMEMSDLFGTSKTRQPYGQVIGVDGGRAAVA